MNIFKFAQHGNETREANFWKHEDRNLKPETKSRKPENHEFHTFLERKYKYCKIDKSKETKSRELVQAHGQQAQQR
jgi:hypothetical protein